MKDRRNKVDEVTWTDDENDDFLDLSETWSGPEPESALDVHLRASMTEPHEPEPEYEDDAVTEYEEAIVEEYEAKKIEDYNDLSEDEWAREFEFSFEDLVSKKLEDLFDRGPEPSWEKE